MITREIALALRHGQTLHHIHATNADDTPMRCHVTGKCKTLKTRPDDFSLPVKYDGVPDPKCFWIEPYNAHEWSITE